MNSESDGGKFLLIGLCCLNNSIFSLRPLRLCVKKLFSQRRRERRGVNSAMIRNTLLAISLLSMSSGADDASPGRLLLSSVGSERATSGSGGKLATFGRMTHVVWQDATAEGYFNRVRSVDRGVRGRDEEDPTGSGRRRSLAPLDRPIDRRGHAARRRSGTGPSVDPAQRKQRRRRSWARRCGSAYRRPRPAARAQAVLSRNV